MYDSQTALIANYINPIIGDMEVQDITTRVVDKYIQSWEGLHCQKDFFQSIPNEQLA